MSKRPVRKLGAVQPSPAEVEYAREVRELQARLEALDHCMRGRAIALTSSDWKDVFALTSGKPAARCRAALNRWAPRKEVE